MWAKAPLAPFTTIATGGRARLLVTVRDPDALAHVLAALESTGVDWFCLGAGSNLLVADRGYDGVVIKLDEGFHYVEGLPSGPVTCATATHPAARTAAVGLDGESPASGLADDGAGSPVVLTVGAAVYLARLAAVVAEAGLTGMEHACGIPGSVGGAVAMNAGAYGWCLRDVVREVEVVSASGIRWVPACDLEWGYRFCRLPERTVVTAARIVLERGDRNACLECQRAYLRQRRQKQPRSVRTFGSAFKNPPGQHAGRLVEAAGLKGVRRGGAEISSVHANFLVNLGDATTADVLALMALMRQGVERMSGIVLEPEVKLLGGTFPWEAADERRAAPFGSHG